MVRTYRVGRPEFPIADGRGAALTGGRWNSVGSAIIYTADTPVTAMLEAGVEHNRDLWSGGMLAEFSIPDEIIGRNILSRLIDDPKTRREVGDDWLRSGANCVLEVSSDQVSGGRLYLINPAHPDYHPITYSTSILTQGPVIRFPPG
jgi:RES domain-containing protein